MRAPVHLRAPRRNPPARDKGDCQSFARRRAAVRHHRRSRRVRAVAVDIFWALLLLTAGMFVIGVLIAGFRAA